MDAEQTFVPVRLQPPNSLMLTTKMRAALVYISMFIAITSFCFLVFMHAHYVNQPACSSEFSGFLTAGAELMLIKITSAGLWLHNESELNRMVVPDLKTVTVQWLENKSKTFEPTYLYTIEKGYFLLPESAKSFYSIRSVNLSISARHSCFGNRWQQLLINRFVGYDTILINSLLSSPGQGFLHKYQAKKSYNISYAKVPREGLARFTGKLVTKCGILMMSFFVFFTTTTSAAFILRATEAWLLKFSVELQHHALHGLPTLQLFFVHVLELLVFVPIMTGIQFFLFEFYDDQPLAFMVSALVWLCELFIVSVRTPISMKFFTLFFLLYFLVFHMYFFFYPNGFTYLAFCTKAAFTLHLILYFWSHIEVPAFERFMTHMQELDITQSTTITSTVHIRRLNRSSDQGSDTDSTSGTGASSPRNNPAEQTPGQAEPNPNPRFMSSFGALLPWIFLEVSSSGLNSLFSMFRGVRDQGQVLAEPPEDDDNPEEVFSDAQEQ